VNQRFSSVFVVEPPPAVWVAETDRGNPLEGFSVQNQTRFRGNRFALHKRENGVQKGPLRKIIFKEKTFLIFGFKPKIYFLRF
jgi:hypothetical protein